MPEEQTNTYLEKTKTDVDQYETARTLADVAESPSQEAEQRRCWNEDF